MMTLIGSCSPKTLSSFSSNLWCTFLSYRSWAKAVRRSTPHLHPLPSLAHPPPTEHHLAPRPLLLAAALLSDSPVSLKPTSAPLLSPRPPLLPASPLFLLEDWAPLTERGVHRAPSPPCRAAARCSLWRSSSLLGPALKTHTVRWVQFPPKVRSS